MSMIGRFFAWWGGELTALIPAPLRRLLAPRRSMLVVTPADAVAADEDGAIQPLHLTLLQGRRRHALGAARTLSPRLRRRIARAIRQRRLELVLALPPGRTVEQRVSLPLAAEEDLAGVIAFEFDRLTPFSAREVYAAHRPIGRNEVAGKLDVSLVYARRDALDPLLVAVENLGFGAPARLDILGTDAGPKGLDLLAGDRPARSLAGRRLTGGLTAAAALIAVAYLGLDLQAREDEAERLRQAVFEARQIARSIEGAAGGGTNAAFAAHQVHAVAPAPGTVVTAMTEVLPDDTYLDRLTIEGERIQAVGLSTQATALVGLLDADPRFAEPRYAAPITQTSTGEARFLIEARFRRAEDEQ